MIVTEKNKLVEEAKNLKESIGTLTNDNGVKMRETTGLKKTIQDKENELNRLRLVKRQGRRRRRNDVIDGYG